MFPVAPQDQWSHLRLLAHRRTLLKESTVYRAASKPGMSGDGHEGGWREKVHIRSAFQPFVQCSLSGSTLGTENIVKKATNVTGPPELNFQLKTDMEPAMLRNATGVNWKWQ